MNERAMTQAADHGQVATAAEIRANVNLIQEVLRAVMQDGTHFGKIPGCDKPSLFKPGAEKILSTFRIAIDPIVEDLSTHDASRYRVACRATSQITGAFLGAGVGECSSAEEKYAYRSVVHENEWNATPEDRRRIKYMRDGREIKQIRTNPSDVANTVLKMAKKRAQIDVTLTVTAASDIFTQDIEDLPAELRETAAEDKPAMTPPRAKDEPAQKPAGLFVTEYSQKAGKTAAGKPWVLHIARFSDGREATTFHESIGALLARSKDHGVALDVVIEPSQKNPDKLVVTEAAEVAA